MLFLGFNVYLHDKGQFWPGLEMARTGLSHVFFLPKVYWLATALINMLAKSNTLRSILILENIWLVTQKDLLSDIGLDTMLTCKSFYITI
jgi:hypothetical protein